MLTGVFLMNHLNSEQVKKLRSFLSDISEQLTIIEEHRGYINDALELVEEELEIPKKFTRKLAKVYHAKEFLEAQSENDNFQFLLEVIR
jgi:hypothetical protein